MAPSIIHELESCAVSRDHPWHISLVEGRASWESLRTFCLQQWHFHRRYQDVAAILLRRCPRSMSEEIESLVTRHDPSDGKSLLYEWEAVCSDLGLGAGELADSSMSVACRRMLAVQRRAAEVEPFGSAYVALTASVTLESSSAQHARRRAFIRHYGVEEDSATYFGSGPAIDLAEAVSDLLRRIERQTPIDVEIAASRCADILRARWAYFSEISTQETRNIQAPRDSRADGTGSISISSPVGLP